jgi:hypothetical protein
MPEEQIRCRAAPLLTVLTAGLIRTRVNYGIVHVVRLAGVGPQIAVPRGSDSQGKHVKAVKGVEGCLHDGDAGGVVRSSSRAPTDHFGTHLSRRAVSAWDRTGACDRYSASFSKGSRR